MSLKLNVTHLNIEINSSVQYRRMDTEKKKIMCKRKLDEKRKELKTEEANHAKKKKEKIDCVNSIEREIEKGQKEIHFKQEEVKKLNCAIHQIKVEETNKRIRIEDLKTQIDTLEKDSDRKVSMIQEEVGFYQTLINDLGIVSVTVETPSSNLSSELLNFINATIREKEKELECPVCLEIAGAPVYMCVNSHVLCFNCEHKLGECPKCRSELPKSPLRHRYAEKIVDELQRLGERKKSSEERTEHIIKFTNELEDESQGINEIHFRVVETTKMDKLKKIFSERVSVPVNRLRFVYDGRFLNDDDTPESLLMDKVEKIDVYEGVNVK